MNNQTINNFTKDEEPIDSFFANYAMTRWWEYILEPLMLLNGFKFHITVTNKGLHMQKFSLFNKPKQYTYHPWNSIKNIKFQKTLLLPILKIIFHDGTKMHFSLYYKLNKKTKEYLLSKFNHSTHK